MNAFESHELPLYFVIIHLVDRRIIIYFSFEVEMAEKFEPADTNFGKVKYERVV